MIVWQKQDFLLGVAHNQFLSQATVGTHTKEEGSEASRSIDEYLTSRMFLFPGTKNETTLPKV